MAEVAKSEQKEKTPPAKLQPMDLIKREILSVQEQFESIAPAGISFLREMQFAMQALQSNKYLFDIAMNNKDSLRNAVVNISAIGLSLNPVLKVAYLVPRGQKVCLDIPFMGLTQIATDSGSILWVQADIIRKKDKFVFNGLGEKPTHTFKPFADRGPIVGVYVVAKTRDGEYLCEFMTTEECYAIRDRTEAWKSYKSGKAASCPWLTDEAEMMKKTIIKRAYKRWPKSERLSAAVDVLNQHEGINFEKQTRDITPPNEERLDVLMEMLSSIKDGEKRLLAHVSTKYKTTFESLDELNGEQVEYSISFLDQFTKPNTQTETQQ